MKEMMKPNSINKLIALKKYYSYKIISVLNKKVVISPHNSSIVLNFLSNLNQKRKVILKYLTDFTKSKLLLLKTSKCNK